MFRIFALLSLPSRFSVSTLADISVTPIPKWNISFFTEYQFLKDLVIDPFTDAPNATVLSPPKFQLETDMLKKLSINFLGFTI